MSVSIAITSAPACAKLLSTLVPKRPRPITAYLATCTLLTYQDPFMWIFVRLGRPPSRHGDNQSQRPDSSNEHSCNNYQFAGGGKAAGDSCGQPNCTKGAYY